MEDNKVLSPPNPEKSLNNKRLFLYLLLVFGFTYLVEFRVIFPGIESTDEAQRMMAQSMINFVMLIPAICVVITRIITKEGFRGSGLYMSLNLKKDMKYYLLAWLGTALLIIVGAVIYFIVSPGKFDPNLGFVKVAMENQSQGVTFTTEMLQKIMLQQVIMAILISPLANVVYCFGEEWGWRGYLLPKMMQNLKIVPTLLINGVIWGLWHAPLISMGHNYGVGYPGYPYLGIFAMCLFCIMIGIITSFFTIKTKSCLPAVIMHGMLNGYASIGIYFSSLENPYNVFLGPMPTGFIGAIGFITAAVVCIVILYKEEKSGNKNW